MRMADLLMPQGTQGFGGALQAASPLLMAMGQGLSSGQGVGAHMPQGMAAMMNLQQMKKEEKERKEAERQVASVLGGMVGGPQMGTPFVPNARPPAPVTNVTHQGIADDAMKALGREPLGIPADVKAGIFAGESGGDYDALFGYQNRPGGRFSGVQPTKMSVRDVLQMQNPRGEYGQYVKGQVGRVATPVGAYQIVGTTLREAVKAGVVSPDETFSPEVQDRVGAWIYRTQGTGAWEGYKGPRQGGGHGSGQRPGLTPERAAALLQSEHVSPAVKQLLLSQMMPKNEKGTALRQNVEWIRANNPGMSFDEALQMARSGQTVNVNSIPNAPAGYRNVFDEQGGFTGQEVIPGGPADFKHQQEAAEAEAERVAAAQREEVAADQATSQADTVLSTIQEIKDIANDKGMFDIPEFGIVGDFLARKGLNQEAVNVKNKIAGLESAIAFDRLQRMREASPTGGALGAVSERELTLLAADLGSIKQSSSREEFFKVLGRVEKRYADIMRKFSAYPNAQEFLGSGDDPLGLRQ